MGSQWYTRPVVYGSDIDRSVDFYVKQLGFTRNWDFTAEGKRWIAQVSRPGVEFIMTAQWPDKAGTSVMFIEVTPDVLDALHTDLEARGVKVQDGEWGYRLMVIADPDGNQFWFAYDEPLEPKGELHRYPG